MTDDADEAACELFGHMSAPILDNEAGTIRIACERCGKPL